MTPQEQEALFTKVRKRFKDRSKRWCSGYVHGVVDEGQYAKPVRAYLGTTRHDYNMGYVYGFADARGTDAYKEDWFKRLCVRPGSDVIEFQWWYREK